jgi:hypothetical protein
MRFPKLSVLLVCLGIASSATAQPSDPATLLTQSSQQVKQGADTAVQLREAIRRIAVESPDVAPQYERLASEPLESRRHLFATLPSSMKSEVWVHHLLIAVTTHSEFTAEQQSVIYDGIRLLSPALYETDPATGRKDVHDFTLRAQRLFSPEVALSLFVEIGSAIPIGAAPEAGVEFNPEGTSRSRTEGEQRTLPKRDENAHRPTPLAMDCACSVWDDWCAVAHWPGDGWSCHLANCNLKDRACGTFASYTCNGLCVYTEPPT